MSVIVRRATDEDAAQACDVLRRSIRELCVADHGDDERVLSAWLANKTPENVRAWINSPSLCCAVAVEDGQVCGVAMVQRDGEIQLCYLAPEALHRGIGKQLLRAIEDQAARWGLQSVFLTSTVTAKSFYERNGFSGSGEPKSVLGLKQVFPMTKSIAPTST